MKQKLHITIAASPYTNDLLFMALDIKTSVYSVYNYHSSTAFKLIHPFTEFTALWIRKSFKQLYIEHIYSLPQNILIMDIL